MLGRVALVDIEFTQADVVVLRRTVEKKISLITAVGALLSVYLGFSVLSVCEMVIWLSAWLLGLAWESIRVLGPNCLRWCNRSKN